MNCYSSNQGFGWDRLYSLIRHRGTRRSKVEQIAWNKERYIPTRKATLVVIAMHICLTIVCSFLIINCMKLVYLVILYSSRLSQLRQDYSAGHFFYRHKSKFKKKKIHKLKFELMRDKNENIFEDLKCLRKHLNTTLESHNDST